MAVLRAWGGILTGYAPNLSIEITRECPLKCPGCYAYGDAHLGGGVLLRELADFKGQELIDGVLKVVREHKPVGVSIVGGEPLVRFRELETILPELTRMGIHSQVVTSAVRPIPKAWATLKNLQVVVSIDGLQPEHDLRRAPATYDRILKHIAGQHITVHCTLTRQQARPGYVKEFTEFWAPNADVKHIWFSLYTPQIGEDSPERLRPQDRELLVREINAEYERHPKLHAMIPKLVREYLHPPASPDECLFAKTTTCLSADLKHRITPCQYGGNPDCTQCGCMASVGFVALGKVKFGGVPLKKIFNSSVAIGVGVSRLRRVVRGETDSASPRQSPANPAPMR